MSAYLLKHVNISAVNNSIADKKRIINLNKIKNTHLIVSVLKSSGLGLEPRNSPPKGDVLPLHHPEFLLKIARRRFL